MQHSVPTVLLHGLARSPASPEGIKRGKSLKKTQIYTERWMLYVLLAAFCSTQLADACRGALALACSACRSCETAHLR